MFAREKLFCGNETKHFEPGMVIMNKATIKGDCMKFRNDHPLVHYGPLFNDLMINGTALDEIERVLKTMAKPDEAMLPSCVHTIIGKN